MTTIVYRDGILATDRQMAHGQYVRPTDMKLHLVISYGGTHYALAFAGVVTFGLAFAKWVEEGKVEGEFPIKNIDDKINFHALLVQRRYGTDGVIQPKCQYYGNNLIAMSEDEVPYVAQGTGDEFALGAMHHGANAIEAVQAANAMCAWSSFGVLYVDLLADEGDFEIKRWTTKSKLNRRRHG